MPNLISTKINPSQMATGVITFYSMTGIVQITPLQLPTHTTDIVTTTCTYLASQCRERFITNNLQML